MAPYSRILFSGILLAAISSQNLVTAASDPPWASGQPPDPDIAGPPATAKARGDIQRVGAWPYGPSRGVGYDAVRNLVFLGSGGVVLVLDASNPGKPQLIGDDIHTQGQVFDVAYDPGTRRLYLACGEGGFEIWDVNDPALPVRLSVTEVLYFGYETPVGSVQIRHPFAIVECEWGFVHSLDVSDPTAPVQIGFNGLMGNPARDIHISREGQVHSTGADRFQRLWIDPDGHLINSGFKDFTYGPSTVYGKEEVAYLGYGGLCYIVDLLIPSWPFWSHFDPGGIGDIVVPGNQAYIVNSSGLHIWDVTVHNSPFHLGTAAVELYPYYQRLAIGDDHGFVAASNQGLQVFSVGDPYQPQLVGHYDVPSVTWQVTTTPSHAYLAHASEGLLILDLVDQARPVVVGQLPSGDEVRDLDLQGDLVYLSNQAEGLRIVDVTDPTSPVQLGVWDAVFNWRVCVANGIAYCVEAIANQPYNLHAVDVSDPNNPTALGSLQLPHIIWDIVYFNHHVYASVHDSGLHVIDATDPGNLTQVALVDIPDTRGLVTRDGILYVASTDPIGGGLHTLDLQDPASPQPLGQYHTAGFGPFHIDVEGDFAYANDGDDLHMLLITDPAAPTPLAEYRLPGDIFGIHGRDAFIYVANGPAGLQIVENLLFDDPSGGLTWQIQDSGTSADLHAIHFVDTENGWVVGAAGTILHTTDAGETWLPQDSGVSVALNACDFTDPYTGWIVGNSGTVLKTSNGGQGWLPVDVGYGGFLGDVCFPTASYGWIVGDDGTILATTDAGATWLPQVSGTGYGLLAVDFIDPLHGWATVGDYGTVLRTIDGGTSWATIYTGSINFLFDVKFTSQQVGWAVGMFGEIIHTTDGGMSWQPQAGVHPPDWLYCIEAHDPQNAWTVGFAGKIMHTGDGGNLWEVQSSGTPNQAVLPWRNLRVYLCRK